MNYVREWATKAASLIKLTEFEIESEILVLVSAIISDLNWDSVLLQILISPKSDGSKKRYFDKLNTKIFILGLTKSSLFKILSDSYLNNVYIHIYDNVYKPNKIIILRFSIADRISKPGLRFSLEVFELKNFGEYKIFTILDVVVSINVTLMRQIKQ